MDHGASRQVRAATLTFWAMVPIGIALIVIGVLEVRWWNSSGTIRLFELFQKVKADNGLGPPRLLRDRDGAPELIVLGVISIGAACLAPFVRRASVRACSWALAASVLLLLYTLVGIGADATAGTRIEDFLTQLSELKPVPGATAAEFAPLFPPAWYSWFEDIAQGAQALAFLGTLITLAAILLLPREQALVVREEPMDEFGRVLRRFADDRRGAGNP